jgi:WD40 repeat protein
MRALVILVAVLALACSSKAKRGAPDAAADAAPPIVVGRPFDTRGIPHGLAYTPDGTKLVAASHADVRVFDAATGALVSVLGSISDRATAVSPDGRTAAVIAEGGIDVIDVASGRVQRRLNAPAEVANALAVGSTGAVAIRTEKNATLFDENGKSVVLPVGGFQEMVFDRAGRRLAVVSRDRIDIFELNNPTAVHTFHHDANDLAFSYDGRSLISGMNRNGVLIESLSENAPSSWAFANAIGGTCGVAFSPDGRRAVAGDCRTMTASMHGLLTDTMKEAWVTPRVASQLYKAAFSPDGNSVAIWGDAITVLAADTGAKLLPINAPIHAIAFARDGKETITGTTDAKLRVQDGPGGNDLGTIETKDVVQAIALGPGDLVLATAGKNVVAIDARTHQKQRTYAKHAESIGCLATSADGERALTTDGMFQAHVWNPRTLETVVQLKLNLSDRGMTGMTACAISPDGSEVLAAVPERATRTWTKQDVTDIMKGKPDRGIVVLVFQAADGSLTSKWQTTASFIHGLAYSPSGHDVILSGADGVKSFSWPERKPGFETHGVVNVGNVGFTHDGRFVFGTVSSRTALWNASTGELVWKAPVDGPTAFTNDAAKAIVADGTNVQSFDLPR